MHGALRRGLPAAVVACLLGAGGAYATSQTGSDGTITACANKEGRDLRIVDERGDCKKNDRVVAWNQRGQQGTAGQQGPSGETGATGATGATGPAGLTGYERVFHTDIKFLAPGETNFGSAQCPEGKRLLGGGGGINGSDDLSQTLQMIESEPGTDFRTWFVVAKNYGPSTAKTIFSATAICASV